MAIELGIPFLETSAKQSRNVEEAFLRMAAEINKRSASQPSLEAKGGATIRPGQGQAIATGSSCCS